MPGPFVAALLLGLSQQLPPADTLVLGPEAAFELALEAAPTLEWARSRTSAAGALVRQAGAWSNPMLSVAVENVGATRSISGVPGLTGLEGQAVLGGLLPVGGDRGADRALAEARLLEMEALQAGTDADVRMDVVRAMAQANRDSERLRRALEESDGLARLAHALEAQAAAGRTSSGEAARAHLAMVSARTVAAEVAAQAASTREELALVLGLEPGTTVRIELPACSVSPVPDASGPRGAPSGPVPEVLAASARRRAASAGVAQRRAARVPDLLPQVGGRRAAGVSALYLGVSIELPLFNRGGAAVQASLADEAASRAELARVERTVAARTESAHQALLALERAGAWYTPEWTDALDRSVRSAEARYRLGEGTLTELLDGRRARLQALDDYERWRAELFIRRAELARLSGRTIDASTLCGASLPLETPTSEGRP